MAGALLSVVSRTYPEAYAELQRKIDEAQKAGLSTVRTEAVWQSNHGSWCGVAYCHSEPGRLLALVQKGGPLCGLQANVVVSKLLTR